MKPEDARAMVAAMFWYASEAKQKAIAGYTCAPCLADPPIGSEVVMRILMQGRAEFVVPG